MFMRNLLRRMKVAESEFSAEIAHREADKILCEALRVLTAQPGRTTPSLTGKLLASYGRVGKRYV